jgi:hypothetical protein
MVEVNIKIPETVNTAVLMDVIERVCRAHDLACTLKGTLVKYPGSLHWHFKKGQQTGTLEITWWANKEHLWFKVADGRAGAWIEETLSQMKEEIQNALHSS